MNDSSHKGRILVVDDDDGVVKYLVEMLKRDGYSALGVTSSREALTLARDREFDLVVTDIEMPDLRGPDLLAAILAHKPGQLLIFITAFGSIDLAVQMLRAGACDFIAKPFQIEVLLLAVERALRERQMRREIVRLRCSLPRPDSGKLVVRSPAMRRVVEIAARAARADSIILITGDSGVGKGALARFIHEQSPRAKGPLVQINCAALPAPLVESELFGVKKGAFTDAREDHPGLFVKATGGTLVLDEVGEMALESQPKLLQALDTSRVRPLGDTSEIQVDVRVVASTNRSLEDALRERRFRPDLYYRLNVIRIEVPPLRERLEDIEALYNMFVSLYSSKLKRPIIGTSAEAMRRLLSYEWPGNVRELANVVERAVTLCEHDAIVPEDLILGQPHQQNDPLEVAAVQRRSLADVERTYVRRMVEVAGGNKTLAARILGIDRRTLYRRLDETMADKSDRTDRIVSARHKSP